jgi:hypothetical protein
MNKQAGRVKTGTGIETVNKLRYLREASKQDYWKESWTTP